MVIVFDVNGTLLDTQALAPEIRNIFGTRYSVREWLHEVIEYSMALTLADDYRDFGDIATAVLQMAAEARGIELRHSAIAAVGNKVKNLPVFADVRQSLKRLQNGGFRLAVLSNSGPGTLDEQLRKNGIEDLFDQVISVSAVRRYKPAKEVYEAAAGRLSVTLPEVLMVAAHPWDLIGAARAGCRTAFVARPGTSWFPEAPSPVYSVESLSELADRILGQEEKSSISPWPIAGIGIAAALGGLLLSKAGVLSCPWCTTAPKD